MDTAKAWKDACKEYVEARDKLDATLASASMVDSPGERVAEALAILVDTLEECADEVARGIFE